MQRFAFLKFIDYNLVVNFVANGNSTMWWRIYFWIILLINIFFSFDYLRHQNWNLRDFLYFLSFIIYPLGIYSFVFRKKIFSKLFWKFFFWISIFDTITYLIYVYSPLKNNQLLKLLFYSNIYPDTQILVENKLVCLICTSVLAIFLLFFVPEYYAIYRLGYPKRTRREKRI